MAAQQHRLSGHRHLHAANAEASPGGTRGQVVDHRLHGGGVRRRTPGDAQAKLEQRVMQQALLDHLVGKPEVTRVKNLQLGLDAKFRDAFGTRTQGRRGGHVNNVAVAKVQGAAVERANIGQQFFHMHQPRQRAHQISRRAKGQRRLAGANFQVAAHAGCQVDDDVHAGIADARHHLAVQRWVAAAFARVGVTHMAVHHGRTRFGSLYRRRRNLCGCDRNGRMLVHCVASTGQGAGDDDIRVHGLELLEAATTARPAPSL